MHVGTTQQEATLARLLIFPFLMCSTRARSTIRHFLRNEVTWTLVRFYFAISREVRDSQILILHTINIIDTIPISKCFLIVRLISSCTAPIYCATSVKICFFSLFKNCPQSKSFIEAPLFGEHDKLHDVFTYCVKFILHLFASKLFF